MIVLFDLWNTLGRKNVSVSTALRKHFDLELVHKDYARFEASMMRKEYKTMEDMARSFLEEFKLEQNQRNISFIVKTEQQMLVLSAPIDGMRRIVRKVHEGHTTALLSNATCFSKELLYKWGFSEHIDHAFFSWKTGLLKPGHQIFTYVQDELDVPAKECLLIDDNKDNIRAAKKAGWQAILFENVGQLEAELRARKILA